MNAVFVHHIAYLEGPVDVVAYKCATIVGLPINVERGQCVVQRLHKGAVLPL